MRVRGSVGLLAFTLALCLPQMAARAQNDKDAKNDEVKKEIQAALDRSAKALESKDVDAYGKELAADYRSTDLFGDTSERDKALSDMKGMLEHAENVKASFTVESVKAEGDQATTLVRGKGSADAKGPDDKQHAIKWDGREVQAWAKTGDGWRQQASMMLSESITMDDKPFAPETKEEEAPIRQSIQTSYDAMAKAGLAGDADALAKQFPETFVFITPEDGSSQKRDDFLAEVKKQLANKPSVVTFKVERAMVKGDQAIVISTMKVEQEADTGDGKKKVVSTWTQRDTWKKTDSGWQPVEFRPLYREWTQDGKEQPPSYAPIPKKA